MCVLEDLFGEVLGGWGGGVFVLFVCFCVWVFVGYVFV